MREAKLGMSSGSVLTVWLWTTLLMVFAGFLATAPVSAQTPTPTPGGDCCSEHAGAECDIDACNTCVCVDEGEEFCCAEGGEWDLICVILAGSSDCDSSCGCFAGTPTPTPTPGGDCCTVHEGLECDDAACTSCVCGLDDKCCNGEGGWDATCVSIARTVGECADVCTSPECSPLPTEAPEPTPTPGPCCEGRELNPGCDEATCEACVCGFDDVCCSDTWDADCVAVAEERCAIECICPQDGDCCVSHGGLGCNDGACQECVLAVDEFCGDQWDADCAVTAREDCSLECPCGDCCAVNPAGVPGCGDKICQTCVCDMDDACCDPERDGWDDRCESIARVECSLDCPCGECCAISALGVPGCGEKLCQDCVCTFDSNCCDDLWDQICVDVAARECFNRCQCDPVSNCCFDRGELQEVGCEDAVCESCVCAIDDKCCIDVWDGICVDISEVECFSDCGCGPCFGDCNGDGDVEIAEIVRGVNIALGNGELSTCQILDVNDNGTITVEELVRAVGSVTVGCVASPDTTEP